jgi:hypothetical protein
MPCFHCHVSINLTASHSAHLLGAKKTWPNKIKRRLGIPIETRAESNQRAARRAGRANPCRWNRRHITPSVDRAQRIAFEDEHKAVLAAERMVCWSKVPIFQYYKNHERTKKRRREYQAKKTKKTWFIDCAAYCAVPLVARVKLVASEKNIVQRNIWAAQWARQSCTFKSNSKKE